MPALTCDVRSSLESERGSAPSSARRCSPPATAPGRCAAYPLLTDRVSANGNAGKGGQNYQRNQSGAGEGNRTLVISLEGFCSTIELRPHLETVIGNLSSNRKYDRKNSPP